MEYDEEDRPVDGIAIIGMSGRFPKAKNLDIFWDNLLNGVEGISQLTDEELRAIEPNYADLKSDPDYVPAAGILADVDQFDANFFGIKPRAARSLDPQQRIWLETAWSTLEHAGYAPSKYDGKIGVFAGTYINSYLFYNLSPDRETIEEFVRLQGLDSFINMINNEKDYMPTRTAYLLNLTGPAINVQTACSTSLVAVALAAQSLMNYDSDMCLAGGASLFLPQERGYIYQEGGMLSSDGHCRPFDHRGSGTVFGSGVGAVLLKRLEDAIEDGDNILAVLKGAALNNDGALKASYTAPSVDGQAEVISMAHAIANITADEISYVEAHGTATPLGDPIEIAGLSKAFRKDSDENQYCAIGAVKSSIGHLDAAAGVAGLIKTILALQNETIPPTLHYEKANPEIEFETTPFYVADRAIPWPRTDTPRRAGISSFGVGGTNAHAVVEEAPLPGPTSPSRSRQLLMLSAKTETALATQAANLADFLEKNDVDIADVAFTLTVGREDMPHRRTLVVESRADAVAALRDSKRGVTRALKSGEPSLTFMFPGQGSQYVNMGRELYEQESIFQETVDDCATILQPLLGLDIRDMLYPANASDEEAAFQLKQTGLAQPAIFTIAYATARLWQSWGLQPTAMVGHSVGEFAAACIAGVFSLEDALTVLANRAKLMQDLPGGSMRAIRMMESDLTPLLGNGVALAACNAPSICIVSGPDDAIAAFDARMQAQGLESIELHTSHAFHSEMMEPILEPFHAIVASVTRNAPQIPMVSTLTGKWLTDDEAMSADYWVSQLRSPVRFSQAVLELQKEPGRLLLEVGPGKSLSNSALQHPNKAARQTVVDSLGHPKQQRPALETTLTALGRLWMAGAKIDWTAFYEAQSRARLPLPTYPFERERYWVEAPALPSSMQAAPIVGEASNANGTPPTPVANQANGKGDERAMSRLNNIRARLAELLYDLSGIEITPSDYQTSFMEMGYDSLTLTQVSTVLKKRLKVTIRFRKLLEDVSTIDQLAAHVADVVPADMFAEEAPAESAAPAAPAPAAAAPTQPAPQQQMPMGQMPQMPQMPQQQMPMGQMPQMQMPQMGNPMMNPMMMGNPMMQWMQQMQMMQMQWMQMMGGMPQMGGMMPQAEPQIVEKVVEKVVYKEAEPELPDAPAGKADNNVSKSRFGPYKTVKKSKDGGLTPTQQAHLDKLIADVTAKTPTSKRIAQENRRVQADPRTIAGFRLLWKELVYQIATERSKGSRVWDVDGNEYVDITMGFGVSFLGHSPDYVTEAIKEQLERGVEIGPQQGLAGEVAAMFSELTGHERVSFSNTGSEAVMAAVRMARTYTGRDKIVYFAGDYHGVFDEVLARPQVMKGKLHTKPAAPGIMDGSVENAYILDYGTPESLEFIRQHADELAAVLIEPVQSRHPDNRPVEFLREIRKITADSGCAMIFDEVITGFRVALNGAMQMYGIKPDLCAYGKIIGGGIPIGVVAGSAEYMDAIDGGYWEYGNDSIPEADLTFFAGTFVRHPMAMAAAKAVLTFLIEKGNGLQEWMNERTAKFTHEMNLFFKDRGVPIYLNNCSSWFRVEVAGDIAFYDLLFYHLIEKGVYVFTFHQNCFFSVEHTDEDIEFVKRAFMQSVIEMQEGGFLPAPPADATNPFALTEAQQEIWLASQMGENAANSYNESFSIRLRGPLHPTKIRQAAQAVIQRHDAFHMRFSPEGDWQRRADSKIVDVPYLDWTSTIESERDDAVTHLLEQEMRTPFDLLNGPVVRAQLVKFADDDHLFHFIASHIIYDGWSAVVVIDEMRALYRSYVEGGIADIPDPESYQEYVEWELSEGRGERGAEINAYWQNQLAHMPSALELPSDRPRPAVQSYQGAAVHYQFDSAAIKRLRATAAQLKASLFVTSLSAFYTLLYRLSGQEDIIVGIHSAGQALSGVDALIGHCVQTLPIRALLDGEQTFAELVSQVSNTFLDAQDHQPITLGTLLKALNVPRDQSRPPIVQVTFNLDRRVPEEPFVGLKEEIREAPKQAINWDIFMNLYEDEGTLKADCDYNTDLFDESTIIHWLDAFQTLMDNISQLPNERLAALPMIATDERDRIMRQWNDTASAQDTVASIHELFEAQVAAEPDGVAVQYGDQQITYAALNRRANQLAVRLNEMGIAAGDHVGIGISRSIDMVVGLVGVMKTGAAYVPLDPSYPTDRLGYMVADSLVRVILTDDASAKVFAGVGEDVTLLTLNDKQLGAMATENPAVAASGSSPFYIIYTSGSTGRPKGVIGHQQGALNRFNWMWNKYPFVEGDVAVQKTTLNFVDSVWEIWGPLLKGVPLVVVADEAVRNAQAFIQTLAQNKVSRIVLVPSLLRAMLDVDDNLGAHLPQLVHWTCSGERLPADLANRFTREMPNATLLNIYGSSEVAADATFYEVEGEIDGDTVPIGKPIDNMRVYIVDRNLQPLPIGVPGEMLVAGDGVAHGYHGQPALTTARFIADPHGAHPGSNMFRTGDIAKFMPDGNIMYAGRNDNQVKLRGYRIELGEIESVLRQYDEVDDAIVLVENDAEAGRRLIAYVQSSNGEVATTLGRQLQEQLPTYMVPASFTVLPAFPLTPNGKIDRLNLPKPTEVVHDQVQGYVAPTTNEETALATLWQRVLGVDNVGIHDNFFEIGGHSLLAVKIFSEIRQENGINLPLATIFNAPTVAEMATHLRVNGSSNGSSQVKAIEAEAGWSPLVMIQKGDPAKTPFFMVHGIGGNVLNFYPISQHLGEGQPFYGLQARGVDGVMAPHDSIEEMATAYREAIEAVWSGPYLLGGYSGGGTVAFEIAQQLKAAGKEVGALMLMDTFPPHVATRRLTLSEHIDNINTGGRLKWVRDRLRDIRDNQIDSRREAKRLAYFESNNLPIPHELRETKLRSGFLTAEAQYRLQPYHGHLTYFKVENVWPVYDHIDLQAEWSALSDKLDMVVVPGDHFTVLNEPNVQGVAARLRELIESAA